MVWAAHDCNVVWHFLNGGLWNTPWWPRSTRNCTLRRDPTWASSLKTMRVVLSCIEECPPGASKKVDLCMWLGWWEDAGWIWVCLMGAGMRNHVNLMKFGLYHESSFRQTHTRHFLKQPGVLQEVLQEVLTMGVLKLLCFQGLET